ncbi:hypothetical protein Intca_0560 [Intrasporangium calvum DSM 43043]|uniref:Uncharacterized protein n=1 Tax=Intrasporangium calvum (strain ATCC 23552 / DSM 43043 / JCM 3097 / NBRC 12989 / NCIMB 10167 / NRRL B-3866 / 7 KIP) TaxID=710696 RepID=E6S9C9_INTC7|nr:hypothetical protein Intca_0560 [Intrasporangium calvum DSM 43043]
MVMHPIGSRDMYIGTIPLPEMTRAAVVPVLQAASGSITWCGASANAAPELIVVRLTAMANDK